MVEWEYNFSFLDLASRWNDQLHGTAAFLPGVSTPRTHWIGGWVDRNVGLENVEKRKFLTLQKLEFLPLGRPARSQSL
jgi:hypothetical protein